MSTYCILLAVQLIYMVPKVEDGWLGSFRSDTAEAPDFEPKNDLLWFLSRGSFSSPPRGIALINILYFLETSFQISEWYLILTLIAD